MSDVTITRADLDRDGYYADSESLAVDGNLTIEAGLGYVRFRAGVAVKGSIWAKAGSGIEAGSGIQAGRGIEAGSGIKAGWGIEAGSGITCGAVLSARFSIYAGVVTWRKAEDEDRIIRAKRVKGTVGLGTVELIGGDE